MGSIAAAVGLTLTVRNNELLPGERAVTQWCVDHLAQPMRGLSGVLDVAFTDVAAPIMFVLIVGVVWWRWGRYPAVVLFVAGSTTGLTKLADLAARPRPTSDLEWGDVVFGRGGYPSGHVVYVVVVFGTLAFLARRHASSDRARTVIPIGCVALIVLVGPSRLVELEHWPADLVAGYLLGLPVVMTTIWLAPRLPTVLATRYPRVYALCTGVA